MLTLFKTYEGPYVFLLRADTKHYYFSFLDDVYRAIGGFNINDPKREDDSDEVYSCPMACVLDRE